jgi:pimeloyl-ACP methyl ester carboxylesterase
MKSKHNYLLKTLATTTLSLSVISIVNYIEFKNATKNHLLSHPNSLFYKWRFGKIHYTKEGNGTPLLLLHEISPINSDYEWSKIKDLLLQHHTVYTLDFLGCGQSDKPSLTYTNFLYVQMLSDFIRNVIGQKTLVITSGNASSIVTMTCNYDSTLISKIIFINPPSLKDTSKSPSKQKRRLKKLLSCPIIGTLIYNLQYSENMIEETLKDQFANPNNYLSDKELKLRKECAHLGFPYGKDLFTSLKTNYLNFPIDRAFKNLNNTIVLLGGVEEPHIHETLAEYKKLNPSIETELLSNSKHYPALENPNGLLDLISIYFI